MGQEGKRENGWKIKLAVVSSVCLWDYRNKKKISHVPLIPCLMVRRGCYAKKTTSLSFILQPSHCGTMLS